MNPRHVELALKKQRLQLQAAAQRLDVLRALESAAPALAAADRLREGWRWASNHPAWLAGLGVALLLARPRVFFRWVRRGYRAWRSWRTLRSALSSLLPAR
jgi:hypothetical protein